MNRIAKVRLMSAGTFLASLLFSGFVFCTSFTQFSAGQDTADSLEKIGAKDNQELFSEIARGIGKDRNSAIQDALKNAVQQSFGVFVESNESLKDGKFSEEILTNSKGYIESYDLTSAGADGDVYRVTVHARISAAKLVSKLEKAKIPVNSGATEVLLNLNEKLNKRIFARDRKAREAELLFRALRDMPQLKDYLSATIARVKQIDSPENADYSAIRTEIRYEYDWNQILNYNRELDRFLRLSGISKSSAQASAEFKDLMLVSSLLRPDKPDAYGNFDQLGFYETRYLEFGDFGRTNKNMGKSDTVEHLPEPIRQTYRRGQGGHYSVAVLTGLKLTLPRKFPDSGNGEKIKAKVNRHFGHPHVRQKLDKSSAVFNWVVHRIDKDSWYQTNLKLYRDAKGKKLGERGVICINAYGTIPHHFYRGDEKHYFRDSEPFGTAPLKVRFKRVLPLKVGETQSIHSLSVTDLEKPLKPRKTSFGQPPKKYIGNNSKPVPWRESVRLTWLDGSELKQPIATWVTTNGKSYTGQLIMVREKGKVAVIRLKDSTREIEIPIEKLTKDSAKRLPADVTLSEN